MKRVITVLTMLLMAGWSFNAWSFACRTASGTTIPIGGGSANVYVDLAPAVNVGQNLVVDLSTQIFCHNDYPETITDYVTLQRGSACKFFRHRQIQRFQLPVPHHHGNRADNLQLENRHTLANDALSDAD